MISRWKENYKKQSIQRVILTTFSSVFIVSFVILAVVFSYYGKNILIDFITQENEQQIEVLADGVEREFRQAVDFLDTVQYKIIKNEYEEPQNFTRMMDFICEENKKFISSVLLFDEAGDILYENAQEEAIKLDHAQMKDLYTLAHTDVGKTKFVEIPQTRDLLICRIVEVQEDGLMKPVVLGGFLRYGTIVNGFQVNDAKEGKYFYIKTSDDQLFYHPKERQMEHGIYEEKLGMEHMSEDGVWQKNIDGSRFLIQQRTIGYTGWKIIGVSSLDEIIYNKYPVGLVTWSFIILVGLVAVLINRYIVKRITGPISRLSAKVEEFGNQDTDTPIKAEGTMEIRHLTENFNDMQLRIRQLMAKEVLKEQEYWSMKMRLLQSQINPHFLYNTLDSIIWMIESKRYDGASKMVSALAGFFRISLNKGGDFITVGKEMTHVQNYMEIQGIRFEDKFTFELHCDDAVKDFMCPKLIIQPLAENAVYHGMEGMYGDGEIEITAYEKDHLIYIDVTDNGEGMTEEKIQQLMCGDVVSSKRGSGIGVRNVNERLKYCFGEEYGIEVISEVDEGTTVRIRIPEVEDLDEYWKKEKNYSGRSTDFVSCAGNLSGRPAENQGNDSFGSSSEGIQADQ